MSNPSIEERKAGFLEILKNLGVAKVVIDYSGSGDSGQIDTISAYRADDLETDPNGAQDVDDLVRAHAPANEIVMRVAAKLLDEKDEKLSSALEQFAYDALESLDVEDWCNNDGGDGVMTIYVEAGENDGEEYPAGHIRVDHGYNVSERHAVSYEL